MRAKQWRRGILILVLTLVALWLGTNIVGLFEKAPIAVSQAREVRDQFQELEARKAELQANLDALGTARGQDAAIRMAFGVARPGEQVIVVVPSPAPVATTTPSWWENVLTWLR